MRFSQTLLYTALVSLTSATPCSQLGTSVALTHNGKAGSLLMDQQDEQMKSKDPVPLDNVHNDICATVPVTWNVGSNSKWTELGEELQAQTGIKRYILYESLSNKGDYFLGVTFTKKDHKNQYLFHDVSGYDHMGLYEGFIDPDNWFLKYNSNSPNLRLIHILRGSQVSKTSHAYRQDNQHISAYASENSVGYTEPHHMTQKSLGTIDEAISTGISRRDVNVEWRESKHWVDVEGDARKLTGIRRYKLYRSSRPETPWIFSFTIDSDTGHAYVFHDRSGGDWMNYEKVQDEDDSFFFHYSPGTPDIMIVHVYYTE